MNYYAHSEKGNIPPQTYQNHAENVRNLSVTYVDEMKIPENPDISTLHQILFHAAEYHDLGKLHPENQRILSGEQKEKSLPINHVDAGAAHFLTEENLFAAAAIQAHHRGYPNFTLESTKGSPFRDEHIQNYVDERLPELHRIHASFFPDCPTVNPELHGNSSVFFRLLLSCLADADHTDTAKHYGHYPLSEKRIELCPAKRLKQLDAYIEKKKSTSEKRKTNDIYRIELRNAMYHECRDTKISENICSCDSPVGSGKTTAIMANLLSQAEKRGLRRIFVVLPFTNIISQSVDVYRKALTLPGENPNEVVAELHHRADFESEDARHLTALWRAPIIVTTAVAFFETLASNTPSTLRRLHELPNSAIFVDESHAALPTQYLPLAWKWMKIFAEEWGCYWILASGSLTRFWEIPEIANPTPENTEKYLVPELVCDELRTRLSSYETHRISYHADLSEKNVDELTEWILGFEGPRIVILNTVQSAAVLANAMAKRCGRESIEHISTSLTPRDRSKTVERIKVRLQNKSDSDWTLVATSCVEAGMDFSFKNGFRELGSLSSLLQAAGRVNREGLYNDSEMWSFCIRDTDTFIKNPGLEGAAKVLKKYIERGYEISPNLSTQAIREELILYNDSNKGIKLVDIESGMDFPAVEEQFKVIESDSCLAVVDDEVKEAIKNKRIDWRELQIKSVQIARYKLEVFNTPKLLDDIYSWNLQYDDFLGYMAGILNIISIEKENHIL